ncbi:hypothetical protein D3C80_862740 [compost metagenome]
MLPSLSDAKRELFSSFCTDWMASLSASAFSFEASSDVSNGTSLLSSTPFWNRSWSFSVSLSSACSPFNRSCS